MDVVYTMGPFSPFNDEELKYSLRSLEKYAKGLENVYVIGHCPEYLSDKVIKIKVEEVDGNKEYRIGKKILNAIDDGILTEPFLFFNDDFFLTKETDIVNYPNYAKAWDFKSGRLSYGASVSATLDYLLDEGVAKPMFYDIHKPIIYEPKKFKEIRKALEFSRSLKDGLVVKSLYGNLNIVPPTKCKDLKIKSLNTYEDRVQVYYAGMFSIYDSAWNAGAKEYLKKLFPFKSKFEK